MVHIVGDNRSIILAYNTVERLLKGDFFHFSKISDVYGDLKTFQNDWPVIGLGTTNWYKRNGEAIVEGRVDLPKFLWADPESSPQGTILDLEKERPGDEISLQSPYVGDDDNAPQFPFIAVALCNPKDKREYAIPSGENIHEWIVKKFGSENLGLAAINIYGKLREVHFTTACLLPIGGLNLNEGYTLKDNFKFLELNDVGRWTINGFYGVNPTIQQVLSVPTHPLHLHGYENNIKRGGHINQAISGDETIATVYPIKDINIRIKDLDVAFLPVKDLS